MSLSNGQDPAVPWYLVKFREQARPLPPVFLLPPDANLQDDLVHRSLSTADSLRASAIKHAERRREFARSRWLIRQIACWNGDLQSDSDGVIAWPPGWQGSLSHKNGAIALMLTQDLYYGLGIDLEGLDRINVGIESKVLTTSESPVLDVLQQSGLCRDRGAAIACVFAFKEAIFKACFPRGRIPFYFHDAVILGYEPQTQCLLARLIKDTGPRTKQATELVGHLALCQHASHNYVVCAVAILP